MTMPANEEAPPVAAGQGFRKHNQPANYRATVPSIQAPQGFRRELLPDPLSYFAGIAGLTLQGRGQWRTSECTFHGGSDSMRINTNTGAWVCMARCGARGGDVLAYEMARSGSDFQTAAKALGAWIGQGTNAPRRPTALPARAALEVLSFEATLAAVAAGNLAQGVALSDGDRERLLKAAGRINRIAGDFCQ